MAATFAIAAIPPFTLAPYPEGQMKAVYATVTVTGTYTTGGDSLTPANFGLQQIVKFEPDLNELSTTTAVLPRYDYTNSLLKFYESGASGAVFPEKGSGESVAGSFRVRVVGI